MADEPNHEHRPPSEPDDWARRLAAAEREAAEQRRRAEQFRDFLASSPDAFVVLDVVTTPGDARITEWSPAAERIFGYSAAEIVGQSITRLLPPGKADDLRTILQRVLTGEPFEAYDAVRMRKDGTAVHVSVSLSPTRDAAGQVVGAIALVRDVTQTRRLEEQYRQAQKMEAVGRLAGGVAHDFNNLLTIINGYSEFLAVRLPAEDPARTLAREIQKAGERAALLTRQLLAFSRKQVLEPRILDLNAAITDVARMLRRLIGEDVELATVLEPGLWKIKADAGQLEQILLNLAVNARDAMPQGGRLSIETRNVELDVAYARLHPSVTPGSYVLLAVSDTGCGMTPEVKAHIFEPFFTTKGPEQGTGLGLATVYGIVKQSGGHVDVYSEPDQGACFKVYLPAAEGRVATGKSYAGVATMPPGTETLLVTEDEDGVRALARHVLQACGYLILEAARGKEALRICQDHPGPIHLLVTDVVMPEMSGPQLAERLRRLRPETKVLYTSGYTDDAVVRHGVLVHEAAFLQKPYTAAALATKVRDVLDDK